MSVISNQQSCSLQNTIVAIYEIKMVGGIMVYTCTSVTAVVRGWHASLLPSHSLRNDCTRCCWWQSHTHSSKTKQCHSKSLQPLQIPSSASFTCHSTLSYLASRSVLGSSPDHQCVHILHCLYYESHLIQIQILTIFRIGNI